jgi:hypothetical protein
MGIATVVQSVYLLATVQEMIAARHAKISTLKASVFQVVLMEHLLYVIYPKFVDLM